MAAAAAFLEAAAANDEVPFAITSEEALFTSAKLEKDAVVVFKQFDDKRADLEGEVTAESVAAFVAGNSLPLLIEFSQDVSLVAPRKRDSTRKPPAVRKAEFGEKAGTSVDNKRTS